MNEFVSGDGRVKKIVVIGNCEADATDDVCSMVDTDIADFGEHIDFIIVNVATDNEQMNHCLDGSRDRHFYCPTFDKLVAHSAEAEELVEEICESPSMSPTRAP